eukprot:TRINITY_DN22652_c0_g1_i1.p1 TRINITY_DN22652_c0_g1~~TRINITY_DN22652_c0_g1_i1.p1  ORF type:complete len:800 (+),score=193.87 TRINITY_DN22652_c0_g1_i1:100-2499(+)
MASPLLRRARSRRDVARGLLAVRGSVLLARIPLAALLVIAGAAAGAAPAVEDVAELSPHGMCAGLRDEPSAGALYYSSNRISPAQCDSVRIHSRATGGVLNWTRLSGRLSEWLELPVEAWPMGEVAEMAYEYTDCGCECGDGRLCPDLFEGCPVGFWIAAFLHCASTWALAGNGAGVAAEAAYRRCASMDPLGSLATAASQYFPFLRLFDLVLSGWPLFSLLNRLGVLAPTALRGDPLRPPRLLRLRRHDLQEAAEATEAAAALVPRVAAGNREAIRRLRYRLADVELGLCAAAAEADAADVHARDERGLDRGSRALLLDMAAAGSPLLQNLAALERAAALHLEVRAYDRRLGDVCPALPFWGHQGVAIEEASFVNDFHTILMEEVGAAAVPAEEDPVSTSRPPADAQNRREAWVTYLIANDDLDVHLESIHTLAFSVRAVEKRRRPFLVLTLGELGSEAQRQLRADSLEVVPLDVHAFAMNHSTESIWWEERGLVQTLARLSVFNLTEFDRIVVLEGDMVMTRESDRLFDIPVFASGFELGGGPEGNPGLNTGIMVLSPNSRFFDNMLDFAVVANWHEHYLAQKFNTDQTFLDLFWSKISARKGIVRFDAKGDFSGCGDVTQLHGGPANMSWPDNKTLAYRVGEVADVHCLLPLEFNYYADFKHVFLLGYRHTFTGADKPSVAASNVHMDAKAFERPIPRGLALDRSARWLVRRGLLGGPPHVVHYPGRVRKPWQRWLPGSRSLLDEEWWQAHERRCRAAASTGELVAGAGAPPCRFRCGTGASLAGVDRALRVMGLL